MGALLRRLRLPLRCSVRKPFPTTSQPHAGARQAYLCVTPPEVRGNLSGREVPPGGSLRMAAGMDAALCRSVLELDAGCRLMQLPDGLQQQAYLRDVLNELDSFAAVGLAEECDDA